MLHFLCSLLLSFVLLRSVTEQLEYIIRVEWDVSWPHAYDTTVKCPWSNGFQQWSIGTTHSSLLVAFTVVFFWFVTRGQSLQWCYVNGSWDQMQALCLAHPQSLATTDVHKVWECAYLPDRAWAWNACIQLHLLLKCTKSFTWICPFYLKTCEDKVANVVHKEEIATTNCNCVVCILL